MKEGLNLKNITVLLATYNGEKYIKEQIDSIFDQDYEGDIQILARDDSSKDHTMDILKDYAETQNLTVLQGKGEGAFQNFYALIKEAGDSDYYAYSDQDDVWLKDKLSTAVSQIGETNVPTIYFSKNTIVNENLEPIDGRMDNNDFSHINDLPIVIIRNICQGNTCVFNRAMMHELKKATINFDFPHDWWTYLVCLSVNGQVIFDAKSHLLYRQTTNNVIGSRKGILFRFKRRLMIMTGKKNHMVEKACQTIIKTYYKELSLTNLRSLERVAQYRRSSKDRMNLLFSHEFYQGSLHDSLYFIYCVLTRLF